MSAWFDRFQKTWASTGIIQDPSDAQANAGFAFLGQAPPTVELFNSLEQWGDKKDTYLYNQLASVFTWGGQTANETNPNTLRDAIIGKQRIVLTADTNYYVSVSGSNSTGNGTIGSPWQTIQFAYDYIVNRIDPGGFLINIQLNGVGTYAQGNFTRPIGKGLTITGDKLNPKNYIIRNAAGPAIYLSQGVMLNLFGVAVEAVGAGAPGAPGGHGILVQRSAVCYIDAVAFGVCQLSHMSANQGGSIFPYKAAATSIIYGGTTTDSHVRCENAVVSLSTMVTTIQSNPTFGGFFFNIGAVGVLNCDTWSATGTCVATKYNVSLNGVLYTQVAGANVPGTIAGVVTTGGQLT